MQTHRKGTRQRIANNLRIHSLIYNALVKVDGMDATEADTLAFKHVVAKDQAFYDAAECLGIELPSKRGVRKDRLARAIAR